MNCARLRSWPASGPVDAGSFANARLAETSRSGVGSAGLSISRETFARNDPIDRSPSLDDRLNRAPAIRSAPANASPESPVVLVWPSDTRGRVASPGLPISCETFARNDPIDRSPSLDDWPNREPATRSAPANASPEPPVALWLWAAPGSSVGREARDVRTLSEDWLPVAPK